MLNACRHFIKKLSNFYELLNRSINYHFKIIDEKKSINDKNTIFIVQLLGKNICPMFTANQLVNDDDILGNFSPKDIKRIQHAYFSDKKLLYSEVITYKILSKTLRKNEVVFTIASLQSQHKLVKKFSVMELINDKKILFGLSKEDLSDICYEAGANTLDQSNDIALYGHDNNKIIILHEKR